MSRPDWYRKLPRWAREAIDQAALVAMGAVAGCVAWIGHPIAAGVFAAACVAAAREREQWPPARWWDLVLDVAMVVLGGLGMGLLVWAVA